MHPQRLNYQKGAVFKGAGVDEAVKQKKISFIFVPGHASVRGIECVDRLPWGRN